MNVLKYQKGTLLVELLVGMAIMTLLLSIVVPLFTNTTATINRGNTQNNLLQEGRWALELLKRDISAGNFILSPGSANSDSSSLVFQRWDSADITYSVVNGELCRQAGAGTQCPVTDSGKAVISSVNFRKSSSGENVTITLTLSANQQNTTLQETVFLLNNNTGIGGN